MIQNIWGDLPPLAETEQETPVNVVLRLLSHASESKRLQKIRKELFELVEMAQSKRYYTNDAVFSNVVCALCVESGGKAAVRKIRQSKC